MTNWITIKQAKEMENIFNKFATDSKLDFNEFKNLMTTLDLETNELTLRKAFDESFIIEEDKKHLD